MRARIPPLNWSFHVLDYLLQYGLFLAEVTTVVIAIGVVIRFLFTAIRHAREYTAEHLEVKNLNRRLEQMADVRTRGS
jgi:Peptidase family S49 N-terminal